MSSYFPSFLTSTPRKGSSSTNADSATFDSSAVDVDRISLASSSHGSTLSEDERQDETSDLYMSVQASPIESGEDDAYLTAGSIRTEESSSRQRILVRRSTERERPSESVAPLHTTEPAWLALQQRVLHERTTEGVPLADRDLFDLATLLSGAREELRWKKSLAQNEKMCALLKEWDASYNPLEGPSSSAEDADLLARLKNSSDTNSVVIPSPTAGIDPVTIEQPMKRPPHEYLQRVLLNDVWTEFPRDRQTDEWLRRLIDHSNVILSPPLASSSSPSSSSNSSPSTSAVRSIVPTVPTSGGGPKSIDQTSMTTLGTVGGRTRVRDEWILELHPARTPQKVLEAQGNLCADCGRVLEGEYAKRIRYCEYYGAVFCLCCSFTGKGIVPARILNAWNFREFPLSDRAVAFLAQIRDKPIIRIAEAAPQLLEKIRSLKQLAALRPRLRHAATYVRYCTMAGRVTVNGMSLPQLFSTIPAHIIDDDDLFSLEDLERLRNGDLLAVCEGVFALARAHIESCGPPEHELVSVCADRAFACWLCSSSADLIFSFQSAERAHRCARCGSFAHAHCFRKAQKDNRGFEPDCAKCKRMQESRIRKRFVSTCDND